MSWRFYCREKSLQRAGQSNKAHSWHANFTVEKRLKGVHNSAKEVIDLGPTKVQWGIAVTK